MEERELVRRAQAGDQAALDGLIERYSPLLRSLVRLYVGSADAADAAQEIWLAVHQKLWQLNAGDAFSAWLRKVAYYHCLNYRKARTRRQGREIGLRTEDWARLAEFVADDGGKVEDLLLRRELRRRLGRMLDELPGDYGLLLRLRYVREMSLDQIADQAELPLTTVKWRLHEGRRLLKGRVAAEIKREGR
ncbi:MAG: elf family DNA-directed polymerase sigma subunit sigw [Symbiobacteriaceae bacterium]|jgi:RNA polymerase sigma-70 factor (ECF subfamily)|nr:elf family DNA-directed polymerase sigma subunit sigw [Symbiobacteriaceae bacterium]